MKKNRILELFKKALEKGKARNYEEAAELLTKILSSTGDFPPLFSTLEDVTILSATQTEQYIC